MICSYLCPVDPHFDWGREICRLLRSFSFSCLTFSPSQWELFDYIDPRCGSLLLILNLHLMTWMRPGWSCSSLELLMLVSAAPTRPGPALGGHRIPLPPSLRLEPPSPLEPAAAFSGSQVWNMNYFVGAWGIVILLSWTTDEKGVFKEAVLLCSVTKKKIIGTVHIFLFVRQILHRKEAFITAQIWFFRQ